MCYIFNPGLFSPRFLRQLLKFTLVNLARERRHHVLYFNAGLFLAPFSNAIS